MSTKKWSTQKRLEFIEYKLFWEGAIQRNDIINKFDISPAQSSIDMKAYQDKASGNIEYSLTQKRYVRSKKFKPAFQETPELYDPERYLWDLRDDVQSFNNKELNDLPSHAVVRLPYRRIEKNVLQNLSVAIHNHKAIEIKYYSNDKMAWRTISPHSFAYDGKRWHVRGYCHSREDYRDFILSRIEEAKLLDEKALFINEDKNWNEFVTIVLTPHSSLNKEKSRIIEDDYNMIESKLHIETRRALLHYYLWHLDLNPCSATSKKNDSPELDIQNKQEICEELEKIDALKFFL
jgi:hypothetical protein